MLSCKTTAVFLAGFAACLVRGSSPAEPLACTPDSFSLPNILGTYPITVAANSVSNYSSQTWLSGIELDGHYTVDFCNITAVYGHTGWNDTITVSVWLPPAQQWNSRLLGLGGGGLSASFGAYAATAGVGKGFATISTDSGHTADLLSSDDPSSWALTSPGNPNWYLLQDWGSRTLGELSAIGKHITNQFYQRAADHSYFTGCSGGGRQAYELAQRHPTAFDGILGAAPAINIDIFLPGDYWATQKTHDIGYTPPPCEIEAFTRAAVEACDHLDGVKDGIISIPERCNFTAQSVVGQQFNCSSNSAQSVFTSGGAQVVEAAWTGPRGDSTSYYGFNKDADLTSAIITPSNVTTSQSGLLTAWLTYFSAVDPSFDPSNMTTTEFYTLLRHSANTYHQSLGAADPHLGPFRDAGGKLLSWHGVADTIIPPRGTSAYYDTVAALYNNTDTFYRHFEAPGVGHCMSGVGPQPDAVLEQLIAWVEQGTVPETLSATSPETGVSRPLCAYPKRQVYQGGNASEPDAFGCA